MDRSGQTLRVTGPERTLLGGFREPARAGGVAELNLAFGAPLQLSVDLDLNYAEAEPPPGAGEGC